METLQSAWQCGVNQALSRRKASPCDTAGMKKTTVSTSRLEGKVTVLAHARASSTRIQIPQRLANLNARATVPRST